MKNFLFVIFVHLSFALAGQDAKTIDNLDIRASMAPPAEKPALLNRLAEYYLRNRPYEAMKVSRRALDISRKFGLKKEEAKALCNIGLAYKNLTAQYDSALNNCFKALRIDKNYSFHAEQIRVQMGIADIYQTAGSFVNAQKYLLEAGEVADSIRNDSLSILIHIKQAAVYLEQSDPDQAMSRLKTANQKAKFLNNPLLEAMVFRGFGQYYFRRGNITMALENFRKAEKLLEDQKDPLLKAQNIFDMAECYRQTEDYEKAFALHQKALKMRKSENDITGLAESYIKLGKLMLDQKDYDQAEQLEMKGLTYAMQLNSNYLMRECYDNLYYIYSGTGNMKGARYFKDLFAYISEMIYTEADKHKLGELQSLLEISEKDRELKTLDAKIQRQHTYITFGIALILVFVIAGTVIYFSYKEKKQLVRQLRETNEQVKRQIDELRELNSTKDKFFSIIGHDLKGPLNSLTAFSNLILHHASTLSEEEMKKIAGDLNKSLKTLYELLENLLTWARSQTNRLTLHPEELNINALIEENISLLSKTAKNKDIHIEHIAFENITAWADKNTVNTVIRNLLSNALKFTPRGGSVTIFANAYKDAVEIGIRDTGVGMSAEQIKKVFDISTKHSTPGTEQEKGTGLGLILCKEFVEKNGGQLFIESKEGKGSTFRFTLPGNVPAVPDTQNS